MKTIAYIAGGYLLVVGAMQIWSNVGDVTPAADAFSQLPSLNSATLNLVVGGAAIGAAYAGVI